jgi:hypothetical protein
MVCAGSFPQQTNYQIKSKVVILEGVLFSGLPSLTRCTSVNFNIVPFLVWEVVNFSV